MSQFLTYVRSLLSIPSNTKERKRRFFDETQEAPQSKYRKLSSLFHQSTPLNDETNFYQQTKPIIERNNIRNKMDPFILMRRKKPFSAYIFDDECSDTDNEVFDKFKNPPNDAKIDINRGKLISNELPHGKFCFSSTVSPVKREVKNIPARKKSIMPLLVPIDNSLETKLSNGNTLNWIKNQNENGSGSTKSNCFNPLMRRSLFVREKSATPNELRNGYESPSQHISNSIVRKNFNMKSKDEYKQLIQKLIPQSNNGLGLNMQNGSSDHQNRMCSKQNGNFPTYPSNRFDLSYDRKVFDIYQHRSINDRRSSHSKKEIPVIQSTVIIDDDEDEDVELIGNNGKSHSCPLKNDQSKTPKVPVPLAKVPPINSLKQRLNDRPVLQIEGIRNMFSDLIAQQAQRKSEIFNARETCLEESKTTKEKVKCQLSNIQDVVRAVRTIDLTDDKESEEDEVVDLFPELTDEQRNVINKAKQSYPTTTLITKFKVQIYGSDIHSLIGTRWLNDNVINYYFNLIVQRNQNNENYPSATVMNTFFYPKILKDGPKSVMTWTRKIDVFSMELILIPIHLGAHWALSVVNIKNKTITSYDSYRTPRPSVLDTIESWLTQEHLSKKGIPLNVQDWTKRSSDESPIQRNSFDCGVFVCMNADFISRNMRPNFTEDQMPYFRDRMIYEIITGESLVK